MATRLSGGANVAVPRARRPRPAFVGGWLDCTNQIVREIETQEFGARAKETELLPDVPSLSEFLPGFEARSWFGIGAPRKTQAEIVDKLNKEINRALAEPRIKARLADLGGTPIENSPADFGKLIVDDTEKWAKVIRVGNIKPE